MIIVAQLCYLFHFWRDDNFISHCLEHNEQSKKVVLWCIYLIVMSCLVVGMAGLGTAATAVTASAGGATAAGLALLI